MKVICIDDLSKEINIGGEVPFPKQLDVDTVMFEGNDEDLGNYYCLERFGSRYGYSSCHFSPLSEIDEIEMVAVLQSNV